MQRTAPYIARAAIADPELSFDWDEWDARGHYDFDLDMWWPRLCSLTTRAQLALTIASGEWIYQRFSLVSADVSPWYFLEAAWAGAIHHAYVQYFAPDDAAWRGPVRGPLKVMMQIVNEALFHIEEPRDVAVRATWMYNLARHLLPRTGDFDAWFSAVVARLEEHCLRRDVPRDPFGFDPPGLGTPLPRRALDPAQPFDPRTAPHELDAFLRTLTPENNPFLQPVAAVEVADDFDGPPYRYVP